MDDNIKSLLGRLEAFTPTDFEGRETERLQLMTSARKLVSRLETKEEKTRTITFQDPALYAALKTCIDIDLWRGWTAAGGGEKSLEELAKLASKDCDLNLLRRLLRLLVVVNIIEETGEDRYKPTDWSLLIGDDSSHTAQALLTRAHHYDLSAINFPSFLAKTSYREPVDPRNCSYSEAHPEGLPFFERCLTNQAYQDSWSHFMAEWAEYRVPWPQFYDTESLINGADLSSGSPLLIDMGGLHGGDLLRLLAKHPDLPAGSLVLQDLPEVVSGANLTTDKIKLMAHNFFEPQPIHGSRAYFFHAVFHDWPEADALRILRNVAPALKKGYSKLLICDVLIPPTGASAYQVVLDVNMLIHLSSYERTEAMWKKLLNDAGFKIIKIWMDQRGNEVVIEAELA
ncbi:putative O-methyltransferase [Hypoxylon sp. FL0890]|nr:putative O-methyltransferase [Hypoxylon sp. FL0890]